MLQGTEIKGPWGDTQRPGWTHMWEKPWKQVRLQPCSHLQKGIGGALVEGARGGKQGWVAPWGGLAFGGRERIGAGMKTKQSPQG